MNLIKLPYKSITDLIQYVKNILEKTIINNKIIVINKIHSVQYTCFVIRYDRYNEKSYSRIKEGEWFRYEIEFKNNKFRWFLWVPFDGNKELQDENYIKKKLNEIINSYADWKTTDIF